MVLVEKPYFLTNEEWYEYDEKSKKYILTNKAPKKAQESYENFYKLMDK
jgi:hypothetical protein